MRVCVLEVPHVFGAVQQQLAIIERGLAHSQPGDVVLLQEMAITGYVSPRGEFDLSPFAEPLGGPSDQRLSALAARHAITLCAPLVERDGDNLFNTFIIRGGATAHYRKRHPWYPETWASPGELPYPQFSVAGTRFTLAICFDVHFLAEDARSALEQSDWLLFPSAWVEDEVEQREAHLTQLARDFNLRVANANWGEGSPRFPTQGRSLILDAAGVREETTRGGAAVQFIGTADDLADKT